MTKYYIEVTDLFGGEMNYSFVQRYLIDSISIRGAISKLSRHLGLNFRLYSDYGLDCIYHSTSKATGVYITEFDSEERSQNECYKEEL